MQKPPHGRGAVALKQLPNLKSEQRKDMHSAQRPRASQAWKNGFTTRSHYLNYAYKQVPQVAAQPEQPAPGLSRGLRRITLILASLPVLLLAFYLFGESPLLHKIYNTLLGR
jgi:hypothetical protein